MVCYFNLLLDIYCRSDGGHVKAKGSIYLSNIRMVFVAIKPVGALYAFDMPMVCIACFYPSMLFFVILSLIYLWDPFHVDEVAFHLLIFSAFITLFTVSLGYCLTLLILILYISSLELFLCFHNLGLKCFLFSTQLYHFLTRASFFDVIISCS